MTEFWEHAFVEKQRMWGGDAARSAEITCEHFVRHGVKQVLIPGIGYGRNARPFLEKGMSVVGIEISATAIELAQKQSSGELSIVHGSVTDMPFDERKYDGIFCHGLVYLLHEKERAKFLRDCYESLRPGGHMVCTVIAKSAPMYGQGTCLGKDCYERLPGLSMFFYDEQSVAEEFGPYGLIGSFPTTEPAGAGQTLPFLRIVCQKAAP